jgi:hypothetical protein
MKKIIISLLLSASVFAQQRLGYPREEFKMYLSYNPRYTSRFLFSSIMAGVVTVNTTINNGDTFAGETMKKNITFRNAQQLQNELGAPQAQNRFWGEMDEEWLVESFYDKGLDITHGEQSKRLFDFDLYPSDAELSKSNKYSASIISAIMPTNGAAVLPYYFSIGDRYRLGIGHPVLKQILTDYKGEKKDFGYRPSSCSGLYQDTENKMLDTGQYIFSIESNGIITDAIIVITVNMCKRIEKIHFANPS